MTHIYVSFSKDQTHIATRIHQALSQRDYNVWLENADQTAIDPALWNQQDQMLEQADILILLLDSVSVGWRHHLITAKRRGITLIPVAVEPLPDTILQRYSQYIDAKNDPLTAIAQVVTIIQAKTLPSQSHGQPDSRQKTRNTFLSISAGLSLVGGLLLILAASWLVARQSQNAVLPTLAVLLPPTGNPQVMDTPLAVKPGVQSIAESQADGPTLTPKSVIVDTPDSAHPTPDHTQTQALETASPTVDGTVEAIVLAPTLTQSASIAPLPAGPTPAPPTPAERNRTGGSLRVAFDVEPAHGPAPLTVNFLNQSEGPIVGYRWDFDGDGVADSIETDPPAHTYSLAGTYVARLSVSMSDGTEFSALKEVTVDPSADTPPGKIYAAFAAAPDHGTAPLGVEFVNGSGGAITAYAWDFDGDKIVDSTLADPPPFTYNQPGIYFPSLSIAGADGEQRTSLMTIVVEQAAQVAPPVAAFIVSPTDGEAPLTVMFTNKSTGQVNHYSWDFNGDSVRDSIDANPGTFTFKAPGTYIASLRVSGPGGLSQLATTTISVRKRPAVATSAPPASATPQPTSTPTATFTLQSTTTATMPPATLTETPTWTLTPSPTSQSTATLTGTATITPSPTSSPTWTPTVTHSSTPSATATTTPSVTPTPTPSWTPPASFTPTPSLTWTPTSSFTPSPTPSSTATPTKSVTPTNTAPPEDPEEQPPPSGE